jgi:hypothetical protein
MCARQSKYPTISAAAIAIASVTRANTLASINQPPVTFALMRTKMLTRNSTALTTVMLPAFLTVSPSSPGSRETSTDSVPHRAFNLDAEHLELGSRHPEALRVAHDSTPVEEHNQAVFPIQHGIDLLMNMLAIAIQYLPKSHGVSLNPKRD